MSSAPRARRKLLPTFAISTKASCRICPRRLPHWPAKAIACWARHVRDSNRPTCPSNSTHFDFEFLGLIGLSDPIRPSVAAAIRECYSAGIRVVMITGDYPGTAMNIARQIGLVPADEVVTGPELSLMTDAELQRRIAYVNIFARVVPEQKHVWSVRSGPTARSVAMRPVTELTTRRR